MHRNLLLLFRHRLPYSLYFPLSYGLQIRKKSTDALPKQKENFNLTSSPPIKRLEERPRNGSEKKKRKKEKKNKDIFSKPTTSTSKPARCIPTAYKSFGDVTPVAVFIKKYHSIQAEDRLPDIVRVAGRVCSIRDMGSILFLTIRSGIHKLQVIKNVDTKFTKESLKALRNSLSVGDIIGAEGTPGRTQKGELSLYASRLEVLAPYVCSDLTICPDAKGYIPLSDTDIKYRYRFLDLLSNPTSIEYFIKRHKVVKSLREYLNEKDFVEVETPILHSIASGANAKPFVTHHNANNTELFLRIAPELHLKQCVVGGMERVYEIGRVFRNEDTDRTHNPEFTTCEFYAAYHTYEDLMQMTEEILRRMALEANGTTALTLKNPDGSTFETDLSEKFRRVCVYDEIQRAAGVELPPPTELNTSRGMAYMAAIMLRHDIPLPSVRTASKMFDKLIEFFITDRVREPTFVTNHPLFMSPLSKECSDKPGISERFELFINGMELCNAYTELSDPHEQYFRFQQQLLDRQTGDDEAMQLDEIFLKALQVGLPPTAGWGMGIDRAVMLLNGSTSIRDSMLFPLLREDSASHDGKRRHKTASFFGFNSKMTLFCLSTLESELTRRGAPSELCERVRELMKTISHINSDNLLFQQYGDLGSQNRSFDITIALLHLFCGRSFK